MRMNRYMHLDVQGVMASSLRQSKWFDWRNLCF
jgi:hypothetical protein